MSDILMAIRRLHRPDGADELLLVCFFPTLKRGANDRCASGAIEIGSCLVNKMDSFGCPVDVCFERYSCLSLVLSSGWRGSISDCDTFSM